MLKRIEKSITENGLIAKGDRVLVALSGGADSVALLMMLFRLREKLGFTLAAAHFNHSIRETAGRDQEFCREICGRAGIEFYSKKADVPLFADENGLSLETAARKLRYDFLYDICKKEGFNKLATAHQLNDNAESILMHLIRGSGMGGLVGIRAATYLEKQGVTLIRPLLSFKKEELVAFLDENGEWYCEDETNFDTDAARNYLRLEVIPRIEKNINSAALQNICRAGRIAAEDEAFLTGTAEKELEKARTERGFDRKALSALPPSVKKRCLRLALSEKATLVDIEEVHLIKLSELLNMNSGAEMHVPHSRVRISFDDLVIEKTDRRELEKEGSEKPRSYPIHKKNGTVKTPFGVFTVSIMPISELSSMEKTGEWEYNVKKCSDGSTAFMDAECLKGPLFVRTRLPGDRFRPLNSPWKMKLKDYLIGKKVDDKQRSSMPLVLCGEDIVFIPGFTSADTVKLTDGTKTVLKLVFAPAAENRGE